MRAYPRATSFDLVTAQIMLANGGLASVRYAVANPAAIGHGRNGAAVASRRNLVLLSPFARICLAANAPMREVA